MAAAPPAPNHYTAGRPVALGLAKLLMLTLSQLPVSSAVPIIAHHFHYTESEGKEPDDPSLWLYLGIAAVLVLSGGAFAGLTIALMGQDEIYLQVIKTSGEGSEKKNAASVLNLLKKGKHWVLVTLLLSNVITNETLPIVLDRSLGGGWPAILGSTILIVIFGEIVPQSICVRYGLPIGAWMAPGVLALMYIMSPVAWPIAKLLDYLLGEDHGTIYKKAGLKTLVTLHRTLGEAGEQLNADEVTIISAVLDLKEKTVGTIMTPMEDVFTMSADTVLDEQTMDLILSQGYSRIPIHAPDNPINFVGMLLVKMLITYDPEDCKKVREFALATLPETRPETSCLDIVNFFQEGKSHMVLVSEYPGEDHGALGVVTLEDVIEELIGEEIIDESDVFVDVHKAIRRMAPAPKSRVPKGKIVEEPPTGGLTSDANTVETDGGERSQTPRSIPENRRRSSVEAPPPRFQLRIPHDRKADSPDGWVMQRGATDEIREHLKHLGPSNLASRPRSTRYQNVKIKRNGVSPTRFSYADSDVGRVPTETQPLNAAIGYQGGIGAGLLHGAGNDAKDGVHALKVGYGAFESPDGVSKGTTAQQFKDLPHTPIPEMVSEEPDESSRSPRDDFGAALSVVSSGSSDSQNLRPYQHQGPARSGSITEQIVDLNGIRKVVLHTTSTSSSETETAEPSQSKSKPKPSQGTSTTNGGLGSGKLNGSRTGSRTGTGLADDDRGTTGGGDKVVRKKRRNRRRGQTTNDAAEQQPLLR